MKLVELYGRVRYAVQIEGISRREAARRFGVGLPKSGVWFNLGAAARDCISREPEVASADFWAQLSGFSWPHAGLLLSLPGLCTDIEADPFKRQSHTGTSPAAAATRARTPWCRPTFPVRVLSCRSGCPSLA